MKITLGERGRRRLRVAVIAGLVLAGASAGGRILLASASSSQSSPGSAHGAGASPGSSASRPGPNRFIASSLAPSARRTSGSSLGLPLLGVNGTPRGGAPSAGKSTFSSASSGSQPAAISATANPGTLAAVEPVGPDIVRTGTVNLRVGKGTVGSQMSKIAEIAAVNGGYVDSSSMSGGSLTSPPLSGQVAIRVLASDFTIVLNELSGIGKVSSEQASGQDVTGQIAENAATIQVLQEEVNLLQGKLSEATDISVFLQIESQLAPVQQQLQQLESQQAVLQNSASFAAFTVNLASPGAPMAPTPRPRVQPNAARVAWHYASHNTLVVLDGIAVAAGWALPLLVIVALAWLIWRKLPRRNRQITTA